MAKEYLSNYRHVILEEVWGLLIQVWAVGGLQLVLLWRRVGWPDGKGSCNTRFGSMWLPTQGFPSGLAMQKTQEIQVQSLGREEPLEDSPATHSSILTWRIPWTEEPGRLQSIVSQSQTQLKRLSRQAHFRFEVNWGGWSISGWCTHSFCVFHRLNSLGCGFLRSLCVDKTAHKQPQVLKSSPHIAVTSKQIHVFKTSMMAELNVLHMSPSIILF